MASQPHPFGLRYKRRMTAKRSRDRPMFSGTRASAAERDAGRPGDALVEPADVVMDRAFTVAVAEITPPGALVYWSRRGRTSLTWSIVLEPVDREPGRTRVFLRLRMAPVRHQRLARTAGGLFGRLTVAGMAAGLAERVGGPRIPGKRDHEDQ
jgi:hypothetical protein